MPSESRRPCAKCGRNRAERFYVSARGTVCSDCRKRRSRSASRSVRLRDTYGITEAEYQALLDEFEGGCWICGGKRRRNLDVDHDHKVERALLAKGVDPVLATRRSIRGLLCPRCNRRLLPSARDSVGILQNAIDYLGGYPCSAQDILTDLEGVQ